MTHEYNISGMSCGSCVAKVKNALLKLGDVTDANVQLTAPQATITMQKHVPLSELQAALQNTGNFRITESGNNNFHSETVSTASSSWIATYKPILVIFAYITGITLLVEANRGSFYLEQWMQNFMAVFFLSFSFFKILHLESFANSYSTYDIIAKKWKGWGYLYAFIELALGIGFLLHFNPLITNGVAFVVMSISIIGVLQSVLSKRKIQCACLGSIFSLPMSTITVIEDALMIAMSAIMIVKMNW
jgi:copper chaperone CopZ